MDMLNKKIRKTSWKKHQRRTEYTKRRLLNNFHAVERLAIAVI